MTLFWREVVLGVVGDPTEEMVGRLGEGAEAVVLALTPLAVAVVEDGLREWLVLLWSERGAGLGGRGTMLGRGGSGSGWCPVLFDCDDWCSELLRSAVSDSRRRCDPVPEGAGEFVWDEGAEENPGLDRDANEFAPAAGDFRFASAVDSSLSSLAGTGPVVAPELSFVDSFAVDDSSF